MNYKQNEKINQVKESTLVVGIDIGSTTQYALSLIHIQMCIRDSSTPMLRRYRKVHLIDSHGVEITLLLSKSARLKIGEPYRFYFQKGARPTVGNDYLDAALSTNSFLGYEAISEPQKAELKDMTDIPLMFFEGTEIYLYCNHFTKRIQLLDKVMYNVLYVNQHQGVLEI